MALRILITNIRLKRRTGTEIYVRDLALELLRQGHTPAVFTSFRGAVAEELERAGIPVSCHLRSLRLQPDVIHGHHRYEMLAALSHFPECPAIFVCHSHTYWADRPPVHPRIRRYFGVSRLCVERLLATGIPASKTGLLLNFVDTQQFVPRPPLPEQPRRALVFSNYASAGTHLPAVAEACRRAGLKLDVVGAGVDNQIERPQDVLGGYDIVFAKAKAAMEAMAVGAAVVLCDFGGVGPMVTAGEFEALRQLNFGFQALREPLRPECILQQIARYDPADAARVRDRIRATASLEQSARAFTDLYSQVMAERIPVAPYVGADRITPHLLWQMRMARLYEWWAALSPSRREQLYKLPGLQWAARVMKALISK